MLSRDECMDEPIAFINDLMNGLSRLDVRGTFRSRKVIVHSLVGCGAIAVMWGIVRTWTTPS